MIVNVKEKNRAWEGIERVTAGGWCYITLAKIVIQRTEDDIGAKYMDSLGKKVLWQEENNYKCVKT